MSLTSPISSAKASATKKTALPRRSRRWRWRAVGLVVLTCASVGLFGFGPRARFVLSGVDSIVVAHSVAPPDVGLALPPITVLSRAQVNARPALPGAGHVSTEAPSSRPQEQLRAWAQPLSTRLNIPLTAMEAYGFAAAQLATERPGCHLTWTMLAGIGRQESNHGRFGGAHLDASGHTTVPIRGPALDGSEGVQRIPDTDHGQLDGDPVWDRAMGPFQFIPATWKRKGRDADGDGIADPDNISDAALTAGTYLCEAGTDLGTADGWWRALNVYNQSHQYGQDVLDDAARYGLFSRDR